MNEVDAKSATQRAYLDEMAEGGYRPDAIGAFHRNMVPWLLRSQGIGSDATVLDIGAGQGHTTVPLVEAGWRDVVALDASDFNFGLFESAFGMRTLLCDVRTQRIDLPDASLGACLCFHLIEHLPDPGNLLGEIRRLLRPDGRAFIVTPDWTKCVRTFWDDPTHCHPYSKVSLGRVCRMHGLDATLHSWNARFGMGRMQAYRWWPRLGMIGIEMLAVARRRDG
jgi:SAM-dependent methyltransferase